MDRAYYVWNYLDHMVICLPRTEPGRGYGNKLVESIHLGCIGIGLLSWQPQIALLSYNRRLTIGFGRLAHCS